MRFRVLCLLVAVCWSRRNDGLFSTGVDAWCPAAPAHRGRSISRRQKTAFSSSRRRLGTALCSTTEAPSTNLPELTVYNTKNLQKEVMKTLEPGKVKMYTCGPTVYDFAHVGNFRAFLTYDVLKRVLQYFGYDVDHVCNLTDVDDKIINRCRERGVTVQELTETYEKAFMDDLAALNIIPANRYPRATEHIDDMVELISMLSENGLAYQSDVDGSWWFDTQNQPLYGTKLVQNLNVDEMEMQDRVGQDEFGKHHPQDFCLWKAYKEGVDIEDGATWDRPLVGKGRPGWHLECSAMARRFLGDTIDVHCGGIDLKFPHHENEIAQSEGATGKPFCECWVHNGFVNIDNEKMSKSKGNFLTLRTACPTVKDIRAYRYLVVSSQYRNPLSFTAQAMEASKRSLKRIDSVMKQLQEYLASTEASVPDEPSELADTMVPKEIANFETALLDDLSMPRASASLFSLIKATEGQFKRSAKDPTFAMDRRGLAALWDALLRMDQVFGIFYGDDESDEESKEAQAMTIVPDEVLDLVGQRAAAKEAKDWELADSLRARITELGFVVKDVKGGEPIVSPIE